MLGAPRAGGGPSPWPPVPGLPLSLQLGPRTRVHVAGRAGLGPQEASVAPGVGARNMCTRWTDRHRGRPGSWEVEGVFLCEPHLESSL